MKKFEVSSTNKLRKGDIFKMDNQWYRIEVINEEEKSISCVEIEKPENIKD